MRVSRLSLLMAAACACGGTSATKKPVMTQNTPTPATPKPTPKPEPPKPEPPKITAADQFLADCKSELDAAKGMLPALVAKQDKRTIENTLVPFNDLQVHLENASQKAGLWSNVHPL